jgi:hypothetical protein
MSSRQPSLSLGPHERPRATIIFTRRRYECRLKSATQEKLRVAEALESLPEKARELQTARISFSAVRELTRVAVPATERAWLDAARGRTIREVERLGIRSSSRKST